MSTAQALAADQSWMYARLARALRPREHLSVSEWADAYRALSPKSSSEPGAWRTTRTPYLREIMDALSEDAPPQRIVIMKSSQVGLTEVAMNWICYIIAHVRTAKPALVVLPTDQLRDRWVAQRFRPTLIATPAISELVDASRSRDGANRLDLLDYKGGLVYLTSAGSGSRLKSDSIRYVVCDEVDEYDWDVGGRGDPMGLIESRTANFPRRKLLIFSTPTVKGASRIEMEWERSDQRRYQVPCPHCGERQHLEWSHVQWTRDLNQIWYACRSGCIIEERDKPEMLARGEWVPERPESRIRGYHLNALYSPIGLGYSWRELVGQWLAAQGDLLRLKQFLNERLGQSWEDQRSAIRASALQHRAEDYRLREVPPGCLILTAGVDTQDDRLAVQIVGWGRGGRWWVIDWIELPGDPGREDLWRSLAERLNAPLQNSYGRPMLIKAVAIDMGGHHTEDVKHAVRQRWIAGLHFPVLGASEKTHHILGPARKTDYTWRGTILKRGISYHRVGTEKAKDRLFSALRGDESQRPEDRLGHFSADLPPEYYDGLLSEVWDPTKNRYKPKAGRRNEPLDTWVYALSAAHHPLVDLQRKRRVDWDALAALLEPAGETPSAPEPLPATAPPGTDRPVKRGYRRRDSGWL